MDITFLILNLPFPLLCLVMSIAFFLFLVLWVAFMAFLHYAAEKVGLGFLAKPLDEVTTPSEPTQIKRKTVSASWQELLRLVHFDTATANRLLTSYKRKYPGQSQKWLIEKIIWDLERDRR